MQTEKPFLDRLHAVHTELVAISKTPEMRQMVEAGYFNLNSTIADVIYAITDIANHYEQSGFFQLKPEQQLDFTDAQNSNNE